MPHRRCAHPARAWPPFPPPRYHNATHAADVLQTLHVLLHYGGLVAHLEPLCILGSYLAAIIHDYSHVGLTNDFLITTAHPLALRYNDKVRAKCRRCVALQRARGTCHTAATLRQALAETFHVAATVRMPCTRSRAARCHHATPPLPPPPPPPPPPQAPMENHHVAAAFSVLLSPGCDFLACLPRADYLRMRQVGGMGLRHRCPRSCHTGTRAPSSTLFTTGQTHTL